MSSPPAARGQLGRERSLSVDTEARSCRARDRATLLRGQRGDTVTLATGAVIAAWVHRTRSGARHRRCAVPITTRCGQQCGESGALMSDQELTRDAMVGAEGGEH